MNGDEQRVLESKAAGLLEAARFAVTAFRLTREYVGEGLLPALPGWDWYDATLLLEEAIAASQGETK